MIEALRREHAARIAAIHCTALAGDFLPSLGPRFLETFYVAAIDLGAAQGFVATEGDQLVGFVLGTTDSGRMFSTVVRRRGPALAWHALPAVLRRPSLLAKVLETFLYPSKESVSPARAELVVIAFDEAHRRRGQGRALVRELSAAFRSAGIESFKVTVLEDNGGARRFYESLGCRAAGSFAMYGKRWCIYTANTPPGAGGPLAGTPMQRAIE